ncbi:hypothetical protein ACQ4LE_010743 [Meloidogyne hapla]|uniref:Protein zwilch n=1 Tax=Meloidogyne hapla TaxID=6305 RepID=A0A1I8BM40_MELHA
MINFEDLKSKEQTTLDGRFRLRYLPKSSVPVACDIQELDEYLVVVDLVKAEGYEAKIIESIKALELSITDKSNSSIENKENIPEGCEIRADEKLSVTFLSIDKLDKMAALNKNRLEETHRGLELSSLDRFANFELHLVPQWEGFTFVNNLTQQETPMPKSFSLIIFTEGSGLENILLIGIIKTAEQFISFKANYLGNYYSSINQLDRLASNFHHFSFVEAKCRCRFDVLRDSILIEKSGHFVPAMFIIEAEWTAEKKENKGNSSQLEALTMPPDKATALIRFKPGWMDSRISLTDRINELRYLAGLISHLREGTSPWGKGEVLEQTEIIDRLKQLINEANSDAQSIFPFDFTDRLWDVLKLSKSFETLRQSFQLLYDRLSTGEFHVLVGANRTSSLAKMLRMRNPNDIVFPRLEMMTCLQLLVEIGVDRFNGELIYRFLQGQYLPNSSDLDPFFLPSMASLESSIERLLPLHFALQSMIMIEGYVRLPKHEIANLAKRLLTHFITSKGTDAFEKEFVYKANMEDIRREEISSALTDWIMERKYQKMESGGVLSKNGSISNVVHISKNFGIKYLPPTLKEKKSKLDYLDIIKDEVLTPKDEIQIIEEEGKEQNNNKGPKDNFESIYITITRQSLNPFV